MKLTLLISGVALAAYVVIASTVYRFRNPWMSETQLFWRLGEAMRFKR